MTKRPVRRVLAGRRAMLAALVVAQLAIVACGTIGPAPAPGAHAGASASPSPTASPTPVITAKRGTLEWYLAQVPAFPPAPVPVKLKVPASNRAIPWYSVPTTQRVAFITIDDGQFQDPLWSDFIRTAGIPVTSFLTYYFVWHSGDYFLQIHPGGRGIHNHSKTHDDLTKFSYSQQKNSICLADEWLKGLYGRRPQLFRPPYGSFNDATLKAARDCGHGLTILWTHTVDNGTLNSDPRRPLRPGDIILMHYRDSLPQDLLVALREIHKADLVPALLDDYIDLDQAPGALT